MSIKLEDLGLTQEELQQRVVDQICTQMLTSVAADPEDGTEYPTQSAFQRLLLAEVKKRTDDAIQKLGEKYILPNVTKYLEDLCLTETNQWGQITGKTITFVEYLVERAQVYMMEKVNYEGKPKDPNNSYHWKGEQTRITHLVHAHLHYSIETAMKDALKIATSSITAGIQDTVKMKLGELAANLKVAVEVKK